ncbi:MAG: hypothetical protein AAGD22_11930 [Verrucomicrobiota bacterium]
MRYIVSPEKDGIQYGDYLAALDGFRDDLPEEVAKFAADEERFTLSNAKSLHDAWIERIEVTESRSTTETPSEIRITLTLLGQMYDRRVILTYENVTSYAITGGNNRSATTDTLHGDIFTHEVRPAEGGRVTHEIAIGDDGCLEVTCRTFNVEDRLN